MTSLGDDVQITDTPLCTTPSAMPLLTLLIERYMQVGREVAHTGNMIISLSSAYSGARFLLWAQILLKYYFTAISVLNWQIMIH